MLLKYADDQGRTPVDREQVILSLRELRITSPEIAETLGMPLSAVGAVLPPRARQAA